MHPNRTYRGVSREDNIAFAHERGFGILTVNGNSAPLASHIPFLLSECGNHLEAHLVHSNPIISLLSNETCSAKLIISGGDTYISPDWYKLDERVPTWNYVAVHISGRLEIADSETLIDVLERLSETFEKQLLPKVPWTMDKLSSATTEKLTSMIVPINMAVDSIEGTWKLDQNKPSSARRSAADRAISADIGTEVSWMSEQMIISCDDNNEN